MFTPELHKTAGEDLSQPRGSKSPPPPEKMARLKWKRTTTSSLLLTRFHWALGGGALAGLRALPDQGLSPHETVPIVTRSTAKVDTCRGGHLGGASAEALRAEAERASGIIKKILVRGDNAQNCFKFWAIHCKFFGCACALHGSSPSPFPLPPSPPLSNNKILLCVLPLRCTLAPLQPPLPPAPHLNAAQR